MAKPKTQEDDDPLGLLRWAAERKKLKENSPILMTRWWVVDYWPASTYSDEYSDGNVRPAREQRASGFFNSEEDAQAFVDKHLPEPGAELRIKFENLRRITKDEWVNW